TGEAPWYDLLLAAAGLALPFYIAWDYQRFLLQFPERPAEMIAIGAAATLLVMEALRRAAGWALFAIIAAFIVYALLGHLVPAPLTGRRIGISELPVYLAFDASAILGAALAVSVSVVLPFIFLGQLLLNTGGGAFFTDLAMATMGRRRGGAAKISVVASALFGTISGSAVSNVATTGVVTIPLMHRSGYSLVQAGAIEAVASTGGQFMPPIMGAAAFLMAEFLRISYAEIVVAAVIPALLYYFAVFVAVDLIAARDRIAFIAEEFRRLRAVLREGWHFILPFVVLLYVLFEMNEAPELAALYAAAVIAAGGFVRRYGGHRLGARSLVASFSKAGLATVELIVIVAAAGLVIGILNATGGGFALTFFLVQLGHGNLALVLVIAAAICIVLGMGMPTTGVYVLLAALVAPALVEAGVQELAAHMFILYFGMMSMITPPIALAAFAAAALTRADAMRTGWASMALGWVAYVVPFMFVLSPTLVMQGPGWAIVLNALTAACAVYLVTAAVVGYVVRPLGPLPRALLVVAGIAAMTPDTAIGYRGEVDAAGVVLGLAVIIREVVAARRAVAGRAGQTIA
ncbi:MAG TPA: TRAP transporter fused permease subunit, partial [Alphaproteobacteria bacterium]